MASKTIIVMSDSHGDREVVAAIKGRYLGRLMPFSIMAILS